jgi:TolB-like protein
MAIDCDAGTTGAVATQASIAVLPFEDLSPNKDQGYFADGVTEEILNSLAQIRDLQVTGRTSSFHFKGRSTSSARDHCTPGRRRFFLSGKAGVASPEPISGRGVGNV